MRAIQVLLFVFLLKTTSAIRCGPNSHFNVTASACPTNCANKDHPPPCLLAPVPRCDCNDGFVLDFRGRCIRECDCPLICPPNSHFNAMATGCPVNCENKGVRRPCPKPPVPRCECHPGYVLHGGLCIRDYDCPKCAANEHFRYLASACPRTCENFQKPQQCKLPPIPRCVCNPGFVRNHLGHCTKECDCPVCPINMHFEPNAPGCPTTCDNKDIKVVCTRPRLQKCVCNTGFVLDQRGICIRVIDCPKCSPFSRYNYTASACEKTCENKDLNLECTSGFKPRCQCITGYVLDVKRRCIPETECPKCRANMRYSFCASACDMTCENKDAKPMCTQQCVPKCACLPGFVLDHNGNCIRSINCPKCAVNAWYKFKASGCPATCENPLAPKTCTKAYVPACECKPKYVLDYRGVCIATESCPKCQPNAFYKFKISSCPGTCEIPDAPKQCTKGFTHGCECRPGYVLDLNRKCIPIPECPKCPQNSIYKFKISACPATCEDHNAPQRCTKGVISGCECKPGFVLDVNGKCIALSQCPKCQPNALYRFKVTACPATCEDVNAPVRCTKGFVPGCQCKPGHVLDVNGICVHLSRCPTCQANAQYRFKVSACLATCENPNTPSKCTKGFIPACVCKPGFVLDHRAICIPLVQCPKCQPNAIYRFKISSCPATCENPRAPNTCPTGIINGCICKPGFVLNFNGKCIPLAQCPRCPPNAIYRFKASACPATCENPSASAQCDKGFMPNCECKPGHVLDHLGDCIPLTQCPRCPPNSSYRFKALSCLVTCENKHMPRLCNLPPKPRCECNPGFVLDHTGICILSANCPVCQPNSRYRFKASGCPLTCENKANPQKCSLPSRPTCECAPGFVLDVKGRCIPTNECPKCPVNEFYRFNASACVITCENMNKPVYCTLGFRARCVCRPGFVRDQNGICILATTCPKCPAYSSFKFRAPVCLTTCENMHVRERCLQGFKPRCVCNPGYVLDQTGRCIPSIACPKCPLNSFFKFNASACLTTCENKDIPIACTLGFRPRCVCIPGFVLDPNGACIPTVACPRCLPNAQFKFNASACVVTCENKDSPLTCTLGYKARCVCNRGFVQDVTGNCIPSVACPSCPPNASFRYKASACPITCANKDYPRACTLGLRPRCVCNPGFVLDHIGRCIPAGACPKCPANSIFTPNATACLVTCENKNSPLFCTLGFKPRCVCKPGFVLDHNGICILGSSCPVCSPNSRYRFKASGCPLTCENVNSPIKCTLPNRPACECNPGFALDYKGNCVSISSCPKCQPNSQYRFKSSNCPATCANPIAPTKCSFGYKPKCECLPGFVLDYRGICIRVDKCPKCPANSKFQPKASACRETCENYLKKAVCSLGIKPRCVCIPGFVNDINGNCIPIDKCPKCRPNSHYRFCGTACEPTCENRDSKVKCPKPCSPKCVCNPGYVRNHRGLCIAIDKCPKCGPFELFNPQATACAKTCANKDHSTPCKLGTQPRCECIKGYVLDSNARCIKECDCEHCGDNSHFNATASGCPATCCKPDAPSRCTKPSVASCECNRGYVLDHKGDCIRKCDCPKCGEHAHFNPKASPCPRTCSNKGRSLHCRAGVVARCECNRGYVMDSNGKCILEGDCPGCPPHSYYNANASVSQKTCKNKDNPRPCEGGRTPRCECIDGYVLSEKDKCIPEHECTQKCGAHEHFSRCAPSLPLNCTNRHHYVKSKASCHPGCVCNKGYMRNEYLVCVKECECKDGLTECGKHSHFTECSTNCPRTCNNMHDVLHCPSDCRISGCACDEGYVLDNGKCVRLRDCFDTRCGKNAHFTHHIARTHLTCANYRHGKHIRYSHSDTGKCQCKKGYYLDHHSNCIPASRCPKY